MDQQTFKNSLVHKQITFFAINYFSRQNFLFQNTKEKFGGKKNYFEKVESINGTFPSTNHQNRPIKNRSNKAGTTKQRTTLAVKWKVDQFHYLFWRKFSIYRMSFSTLLAISCVLLFEKMREK